MFTDPPTEAESARYGTEFNLPPEATVACCYGKPGCGNTTVVLDVNFDREGRRRFRYVRSSNGQAFYGTEKVVDNTPEQTAAAAEWLDQAIFGLQAQAWPTTSRDKVRAWVYAMTQVAHDRDRVVTALSEYGDVADLAATMQVSLRAGVGQAVDALLNRPADQVHAWLVALVSELDAIIEARPDQPVEWADAPDVESYVEALLSPPQREY